MRSRAHSICMVAFLRGAASGWSKRELASWLLGSYREVSVRPDPRLVLAFEDEGVVARGLLPARAVKELIELVRTAVCSTLADLRRGETSAVSLGIRQRWVACASASTPAEGAVWIPLDQLRMRLEERVTSLFIVDYLLRSASYEREVMVCTACEDVSFDFTSEHRCHLAATSRRLSENARAWPVPSVR
jgi:hypothetical protein